MMHCNVSTTWLLLMCQIPSHARSLSTTTYDCCLSQVTTDNVSPRPSSNTVLTTMVPFSDMFDVLVVINHAIQALIDRDT
jgi:hypothetical protein